MQGYSHKKVIAMDNKYRQIGKTTAVFQLADIVELPVLVSNEYIRDNLRKNYPNIRVYTVSEVEENEGKFSPKQEFLVDLSTSLPISINAVGGIITYHSRREQ